MQTKILKTGTVLAMLSAIGLGGLAPTSASAQEAQTLTFAHAFAPNMSWAKAAIRFKEVVEEETDGQLSVRIFDSGTLGEQRQLIEQIIDVGTNDMTITLEPLAFWVPEINVYQALYLFRDMDHLIAFEEGEVGTRLKDLTKERTGLKVLSYFPRPARQLSTVNTPIESVDDVQGLKLRVTESKAAIEGWSEVGAKPVPMTWGEVFTSLQQGVLDAQENPFDHMVARKTYEITKHAAKTDHAFASVWMLIDDERYNELPAEWQAVVDKAAAEAKAYEGELATKEIEDAVATLEENGVTIYEPDLAPFRERAKASYAHFPDLQDWITDIQAIQ